MKAVLLPVAVLVTLLGCVNEPEPGPRCRIDGIEPLPSGSILSDAAAFRAGTELGVSFRSGVVPLEAACQFVVLRDGGGLLLDAQMDIAEGELRFESSFSPIAEALAPEGPLLLVGPVEADGELGAITLPVGLSGASSSDQHLRLSNVEDYRGLGATLDAAGGVVVLGRSATEATEGAELSSVLLASLMGDGVLAANREYPTDVLGAIGSARDVSIAVSDGTEPLVAIASPRPSAEGQEQTGVVGIVAGDQDWIVLQGTSRVPMTGELSLADWSGDGVPDLLIGVREFLDPQPPPPLGPSGIVGWEGPLDARDIDIEAPDIILWGPSWRSLIGASDLNGDGSADITAGVALEAGSISVFLGPFEPGDVLYPEDADWEVTGAEFCMPSGKKEFPEGDRIGLADTYFVDLDGEPGDELVLSADLWNSCGPGVAGAVAAISF